MLKHKESFQTVDKSLKRTVSLFLFLLFILLIMCLISLGTGHLSMTPSEVWFTLIGEGTDRNALLLFQFRLPRIFIAILVGVGMGVSGAIFQGVTQNGLADPGIIGIHSGSGFFVVLYLYIISLQNTQLTGDSQFSQISLPFAAFVGGLTAAILIYALAWKKGVTPIRLILVGIGVNAGFSAALLVIQLRMAESDFNRAIVWLSGSIWNSTWSTVWSLLPWILLFLPLAMFKARVLTIMQLGDDMATGLGTSIEKERIYLIVIGVALASASVAAAGGISFLGLLAPHLARRLVGGKYQRLIPITACIGASLLLFSDTIARTLLAPTEIPVGLLVSVLGAPYFIYLLMTIDD